MRIQRVLILLVVSLALVACSDGQPQIVLNGSGRVVSRDMEFANFDAVEASAFFHVTVLPGDQFAVAVTADDNFFEHISVTQKGARLAFGLRPGRSYTFQGGTLRATVTMPRLAAIDANANASVTLPVFKVDDLVATTSGTASLVGSIDAGNVRVKASDSSCVKLSGNAEDLEASGAGNSSLDLARLAVSSARVELKGLAQAAVQANHRLYYAVVAGAQLTYLGRPRLGESTCSGNAQINSK